MSRRITTAVERTALNNKSFTVTANSIIIIISSSSSTIISSPWPFQFRKYTPIVSLRCFTFPRLNRVQCYCSFTSLCTYTNRCAYKLQFSLVYSCNLKIYSAQKTAMLKFGLKFHSYWRQFFRKRRGVQHRWTLECDGSRRIRKVYKHLLIEKT